MLKLLRDGWFYWALTEVLLLAALLYSPAAGAWLIALSVWQIIYFMLLDRTFINLTIQVRITFLGVAALGFVPGWLWIYWIPAGYCFLARLVSLMPWNLREPMSARS